MKASIKILSFLLVMALSSTTKTNAQKTTKDSTGFPGDNFSLQGALEMFQRSSSPEEFERLINTKDKNVNNLDLNKDGKTDYVRVIDKTEKRVHAFILQVPVSLKENQDIAVIELDKTSDTSAVIQIVGDKDIYGRELIIEPGEGENDNVNLNEHHGAARGPSINYVGDNISAVIINVWYWPCVRFVYTPVYLPWVSPWYWGCYPNWWTAWRPVSLNVWFPGSVVYNRNYVSVNTYRVSSARLLYTPYRSSAISINKQTAVLAGPNGVAVGAKTTVTGPSGRSATRVSGVIAGPKGAVRTTTVRKGRW